MPLVQESTSVVKKSIPWVKKSTCSKDIESFSKEIESCSKEIDSFSKEIAVSRTGVRISVWPLVRKIVARMRQTNLAKADFCRHVSYFVQCLHRAGKLVRRNGATVVQRIRFRNHRNSFSNSFLSQNSFWNSFFLLPKFVLEFVLRTPRIRFWSSQHSFP